MSYRGEKTSDYLRKKIKETFGTQRKAAKELGITEENLSIKIKNPTANFILDLIKLKVPVSFESLESVNELNNSYNKNISGDGNVVGDINQEYTSSSDSGNNTERDGDQMNGNLVGAQREVHNHGLNSNIISQIMKNHIKEIDFLHKLIDEKSKRIKELEELLFKKNGYEKN